MHESEQELRPCPLCGRADSVVVRTDRIDHWIACDACDTIGPMKSGKGYAVKAWNIRPAEAELVEALEEIARDRGGYMGEYHADCQQIARAALSRARSKDEVAG